VILETGSIYCDIKEQILSSLESDSEIVSIIKSGSRSFHIDGKILKISYDGYYYEWIFILSQYDEQNCNLYAIHDNKMYELMFGEEGLLDPIDSKLLIDND
jgi:hypothetical protein